MFVRKAEPRGRFVGNLCELESRLSLVKHMIMVMLMMCGAHTVGVCSVQIQTIQVVKHNWQCSEISPILQHLQNFCQIIPSSPFCTRVRIHTHEAFTHTRTEGQTCTHISEVLCSIIRVAHTETSSSSPRPSFQLLKKISRPVLLQLVHTGVLALENRFTELSSQRHLQHM